MRKPEFISYSGKTFFFMDFSEMKSREEVDTLIKPSAEYIRSQSQKSVLTLTNIKGMHFNNEIKNAFSEFLNGNKPFVKAGAVVGIGGLQRIVYNGVMKLTGRDIRSFETLDQAQDWLSSIQ
ncbi:hypothetical protein [Carboxylicivirga caseinilyticus]|uniref:hypothetical protein n=1 Tax=Carboxylicivirga caseinilyticus TaxID=3417572 RepID=UPI003D34E1AA|nr:hypothetical protein [Marinilabiliaceae bacterium A049]